MKRERKRKQRISKMNKGFSLVELIIAVAILGIVSVSIVLAMTSSSKIYSRSSVEAQMQSEAQLVANAISELAIDASDAKDTTDAAWISTLSDADKNILDTYGLGYLKDEGKNSLILSAIENISGVYKSVEYVVARSEKNTGATKNNLYMAKRVKLDDGTWGNFGQFDLLGNYVKGFSASATRVPDDNLLEFKLEYEKTARVYKGNYQVMMRNKAYAADISGNDLDISLEPDVSVTMEPSEIYLAVQLGKVTGYFTELPQTNFSNVKNINSAPMFTINYRTNQRADTLSSDWKMTGTTFNLLSIAPNDTTKFEKTKDLLLDSDIIGSSSAVARVLAGENRDDVKGITANPALKIKLDQLRQLTENPAEVSCTVTTATNKDGEYDVDDDRCGIYMLRINKLAVRAESGVTRWPSQDGAWTGDKVEGIEYYAYQTMAQQVGDVRIIADIDASDAMPVDAGGVQWKLQRYVGGAYVDVTDKKHGYLMNSTNGGSLRTADKQVTIKFGSDTDTNEKYKVIGTSVFDPDYYDEFEFATHTELVKNDGFYSRGYYVDLTEWAKEMLRQYNKQNGTDYDVSHITKAEFAGHGNSLQEGMYTLYTDPVTGKQYVYINYDSFGYAQSKEQALQFYDGTADFMQVKLSFDTTDNSIINAINQALGGDPTKYNLEAVRVTALSPTDTNVIVLGVGETKFAKVEINAFNIIGRDHFGIYVDDTEKNLNKPSMINGNEYLDVATASGYGDPNHYVNTMQVSISTRSNMKNYNPYPMRLRLTALDYYELCRQDTDPVTYSKTNSYYDYAVYIANVEGEKVFVPTPRTVDTPSDHKATKLGTQAVWPGIGAITTRGTAIGGYNENGQYISDIATVYTSGSSYKLNYNGKIYVYNATKQYWKKQ